MAARGWQRTSSPWYRPPLQCSVWEWTCRLVFTLEWKFFFCIFARFKLIWNTAEHIGALLTEPVDCHPLYILTGTLLLLVPLKRRCSCTLILCCWKQILFRHYVSLWVMLWRYGFLQGALGKACLYGPLYDKKVTDVEQKYILFWSVLTYKGRKF